MQFNNRIYHVSVKDPGRVHDCIVFYMDVEIDRLDACQVSRIEDEARLKDNLLCAIQTC